MSRLHELLGSDEETFGPGMDLAFSIGAILLIILTLVLHLYRGSEATSLFYQQELKNDREEMASEGAKGRDELRELTQRLADRERQLVQLRKQINQMQEHLTAGEARGERLRTLFGKLISEAVNVLEGLKKDLETEDFPIAVEQRPDRLYFDMGVYFPFESAKIADIPADQRERIQVIGDTFRRILDQPIRVGADVRHVRSVMRVVVEGHTDDRRPANDHFINYYYSKERAFAVMKLLMDGSGLIPPEYRISIAGYAEYGRPPKLDPRKHYDREAIRAKMRRVTISIVPDYDALQKD